MIEGWMRLVMSLVHIVVKNDVDCKMFVPGRTLDFQFKKLSKCVNNEEVDLWLRKWGLSH